MYGGQYPSVRTDNNSAIQFLWAGLISYAIGFVTPQYTTDTSYFIDSTLYTWNLLTPLGLGFIAVGIVLTYLGITKARLFDGVKKYTFTGAFLIFIPIMVIQSIKTDYRIEVGRDIVDYSFGYYALWLGIILSVIGSFKAVSYPQYMFNGYNKPPTGYTPQYSQGYQQGQQSTYQQQQNQQPNYNQFQDQRPQQNHQPLVQPPSYIEPEPTYPPSQPFSGQPVSGNQLKHNYCGTCGLDNEIGVKFCVNCGTQFQT